MFLSVYDENRYEIGSFVMEAPAYIVNDEVAQNIKYACDSNDAGKTASFVSMELYNKSLYDVGRGTRIRDTC